MDSHLAVIYRPIKSLAPYARNSRTHSPEQVAKLVASMREFGWTSPILIDGEGGVIAGHGRLEAAKVLGLAEVPTIVLDHLSDDQKRAYVLADNRLALDAGWNPELLATELADLQGAGFDLSLTGFASDEITKWMNPPGGGLTDEDATPALQPVVVSVLGDTWTLGRHRLRCGDSTSADDVTALFAGAKPHLMVTDPPYGVNYDPAWRMAAKRPDGRALSVGRVSMGEVKNDDRADWTPAWALFPGDVAYVWHGALHASVVAESLAQAGLLVRSQIIWAKQQMVIGRGDYHWMHEPCWYVVRKGKTGHRAGDRKQRTVWEIANHAGGASKDDGATNHSTQKPVECMRRPIENNSKQGEDVYDPFLGSGSTLIAAEATGRHCYGMELDPAYVDMVVRRWEAFTGETARNQDGATLAELSASRAPAIEEHA